MHQNKSSTARPRFGVVPSMTESGVGRDRNWQFCANCKVETDSEVWVADENKHVARIGCGTLVITEFGPASANIQSD
jgi:hypothetical protein